MAADRRGMGRPKSATNTIEPRSTLICGCLLSIIIKMHIFIALFRQQVQQEVL